MQQGLSGVVRCWRVSPQQQQQRPAAAQQQLIKSERPADQCVQTSSSLQCHVKQEVESQRGDNFPQLQQISHNLASDLYNVSVVPPSGCSLRYTHTVQQLVFYPAGSTFCSRKVGTSDLIGSLNLWLIDHLLLLLLRFDFFCAGTVHARPHLCECATRQPIGRCHFHVISETVYQCQSEVGREMVLNLRHTKHHNRKQTSDCLCVQDALFNSLLEEPCWSLQLAGKPSQQVTRHHTASPPEV